MKLKLFVPLFVLLVFSGCSTEQTQKTKKPLPEPQSEGAKILKMYCSECHGMPLPDTHPAKEWSNVVYRMNMRRKKRALQEMTVAEKTVLISYLQKHAADQK